MRRSALILGMIAMTACGRVGFDRAGAMDGAPGSCTAGSPSDDFQASGLP